MAILTTALELESNTAAPEPSKVSLHLSAAHADAHADAHAAPIDAFRSFALKPARRHRQFLPEANELRYESLKGYDHNSNRRHAAPAAEPCEKVSAVKKRGGGSWLLGFARLLDDREAEVTSSIPALVRSNSSSSLESASTEDDVSVGPSASSIKKKGVSFNETVLAVAIPHASTLSPHQRRRMYSSSVDVRQNKIRNKKEYRYDGCDWRNCTEEWEMSVCMVTGELVHPVHSL